MRYKGKLFPIILVFVFLISVPSMALATFVQHEDNQPTITKIQITTSRSLSYSSPAIYNNRIVWAESRNGWGNSNIYMYDLSTSTETQITTSGSAEDPSIYGDRIVWMDGRNEWDRPDIYMYNISTHKETQITTSGSVWSPPKIYGDRIVWTDNRNQSLIEGLDIYMYDLSTQKENQITTNKSDQEYPSIYGDRVVWYDTRNGCNIYMYNLSTSTETQITNNDSSEPAIYKDRIVWQNYHDGYGDICMYNLSSSKRVQITTNRLYQLHPAIYGDRIVWTDVAANNTNSIYMYELSTSKETLITTNASWSDYPAIYGDKIVWKEGSGIHMATIGSNLTLASFSAFPISGNAPLKVEFTDESIGLPTSWKWDLGDGTYSTEQNPVHTYSKAGEYTVSLIASDGRNIASKTLEIVVKEVKILPVADFSVNITSGYAPLAVQFTDCSQNITSKVWDFNNDGTIDSTEKTPNYVYTFPGTYTINLTVSNENGTTSKLSRVVVYPTQNQDCQLTLTETQITNNIGDEIFPAIYGDRIVWQDYRNSNSDVYMYNLSTHEETQITSNDSNDISPVIYGDRIAWIGYDRISTNICIYNISTSKGIQTITDGSDHSYPAIYSEKIVSEGIHSGNDIYLYNLSTLKETQITTNKSIQKSPDIYGNKIIWQDDRNGKRDIYMYDLSTYKETKIPTNGSVESPRIYGDRIVWEDDRDGNKDIYMYNFSTFSELQVTTNVSNSENPAIYGDRIVWQDDRNGNWDIYMYDLSTISETQITTNESDQVNPAIYHDRIVWQDGRNGYRDIYMCTISIKGSNQPIADFSMNVTSGCAPLAVQFVDLSQYITSIIWDFGDGITSTEQNPTHTYSAAGTYTVNLTACSANGNSSKTAKITVLEMSSSSDDNGKNSDGSSHSSSEGGAAGGSPEPAKNVQAKELSQAFVTNGKPVKFDFPKNATCVVYVSFDSKKTAGKTTTIAEQLKNKSSLVSGLPEGEVYKYFNVWVGTGGFATSKNIENLVVCFKVEKSWLQDKNIDQNSIILSRYSDKKWSQLPVKLLCEKDKYLYFTAETPEFSFFAITGKAIEKEKVAETKPANDTSKLEQNGTTLSKTEQEQKSEQEIGKGKATSIPGFGMVCGIVCLITLFLHKRR